MNSLKKMAQAVIKATSQEFGISVTYLKSTGRKLDCVKPRQVAIYLCVQQSPNSASAIGEIFKKERTVVGDSAKKIQGLLETDKDLAKQVNQIISKLSKIENYFNYSPKIQCKSDNKIDSFKALVRTVIHLACDEFLITEEQILSHSRQKIFARPRQIVMYICSTKSDNASRFLGEIFNRDVSIVSYSCNQIKNLMVADPVLRTQVERIAEKLGQKADFSDKIIKDMERREVIKVAGATGEAIKEALVNIASKQPDLFLQWLQSVMNPNSIQVVEK